MPFTFERFVALTAALAAAGSALHGCSSNSDSNSQVATEGRPKDSGYGGDGPLAGAGGAASAGTIGDAGAGGSSDGVGGRDTPVGGSWSGEGGVGGESGAQDPGGSDAGAAGVSNNASAGAATEGGAAGASGGEGGAGSNDGTGGRRRSSTGGQPVSGGEGGTGEAGFGGEADSGGAAGAGSEVCYGQGENPGCWTLPEDECPLVDWDPMMASCYQHEVMLNAGAEAALIGCFQEIPLLDQCGTEMESAIDECIQEIASGACPTSAATEACTTGLVLDEGGTLPSPVANCTDGTLTTELCISALSVVSSYALPYVAGCADPTGEYSGIVTGTCAERIEKCVFPHDPLYPWQPI
jgi:hypothetical protein